MKLNIIISLYILFGFYFDVNGQKGVKQPVYPEIGTICPGFILKDVHYYSKKQVELSDFKGKWLILDFWNEYCSGCITSFPKVNELQHEFAGTVQFLLIGYTGSQYSVNHSRSSDETIRLLYERLYQKYNLKLSISYDSVLFHRFGISGCPYIIVIDPNGIVRGITYTINKSTIADFVAGKQPVLARAHRQNEKIEYDPNLPFLVNGNGGNDADFLYRSLLSRWNSSIPFSIPVKLTSKEGRFEVLGVSLDVLYKFAYTGRQYWSTVDSLYGKFYPLPVLEVNKLSPFKADFGTGENLYCYSLSVPVTVSNREYLMEVIQRDLQNYFGYHARIETRKMPYWRLVATNEAKIKLKSKSDLGYYKYSPNIGFTAKNYPVQNLIRELDVNNQGGPPFVNETGIIGNIDISINAVMSDLDDVKRALHENGLDLVIGEREMNVIVIKDKF